MQFRLDLIAVPDGASPWRQVPKFDPIACELADRHYSRQSIGAAQFMPPGRTFVLLIDDERGRAVWGAWHGLDIVGDERFRCSIFRNESTWLSSELVRWATVETLARWGRRGWLPHPPFRTEVNPRLVRRKRDPGRCFRKAGWRYVETTAGGHGRDPLLVFEAPDQGQTP